MKALSRFHFNDPFLETGDELELLLDHDARLAVFVTGAEGVEIETEALDLGRIEGGGESADLAVQCADGFRGTARSSIDQRDEIGGRRRPVGELS